MQKFENGNLWLVVVIAGAFILLGGVALATLRQGPRRQIFQANQKPAQTVQQTSSTPKASPIANQKSPTASESSIPKPPSTFAKFDVTGEYPADWQLRTSDTTLTLIPPQQGISNATLTIQDNNVQTTSIRRIIQIFLSFGYTLETIMLRDIETYKFVGTIGVQPTTFETAYVLESKNHIYVISYRYQSSVRNQKLETSFATVVNSLFFQ